MAAWTGEREVGLEKVRAALGEWRWAIMHGRCSGEGRRHGDGERMGVCVVVCRGAAAVSGLGKGWGLCPFVRRGR